MFFSFPQGIVTLVTLKSYLSFTVKPELSRFVLLRIGVRFENVFFYFPSLMIPLNPNVNVALELTNGECFS